jgi:hypothetical protein
VQNIDDPKFENPAGKRIEHGVQRAWAWSRNHREIIEKGKDVEFLEIGDLVSGAI